MEKLNSPDKVLVAMSGGVDSTVAALLLKEAGYEVFGATMRLWIDPESVLSPKRYSISDAVPAPVDEGRKAALDLKITHQVIDLQNEFYNYVVCDFISEYSKGRTPNPCVACNRSIKFGLMLERASGLRIRKLATGHYVRLIYDDSSSLHRLYKAADRSKDQSYMLYMLGQSELARLIFPLGDLTKDQVRSIAFSRGLPAAGKSESQEICFIPGNDYRSFLERRCPEAVRPGEIVTPEGRVIGKHRGVAFYTIGQRKGLGLTVPEPYYVAGIESAANRIMAAPLAGSRKEGLLAAGLSFISGSAPDSPFEIEVKIRYKAEGVKALLEITSGGKARVFFKEKQLAVAPGQSAVFYQGDELIGGGIIEEAF